LIGPKPRFRVRKIQGHLLGNDPKDWYAYIPVNAPLVRDSGEVVSIGDRYLFSMGAHMTHGDYFAEMYVAGRFAEAGWNVYFPRGDRGFDFIVSLGLPDGQQLRPVQVKGKYPTGEKGDRDTYGYIGELSQQHTVMVLAIPFFRPDARDIPTCVAYMPPSLVRKDSRRWRCEPASLASATAKPRRDYQQFFNDAGLLLVERLDWRQLTLDKTPACAPSSVSVAGEE
jgi:hypothetical protein